MACGDSRSPVSAAPPGAAGGRAPDSVLDTDADGLCDVTEWDIGTDPDQADSDGDGLPDLVELGNGFGPLEPSAPAADQIGDLPARRGAQLDFAVRATVQGDGRAVSGFFIDITSLYLDDSSAADFFAGATAVAAEPMDGPRSINADSAEFTAVLGKTRLFFNVRFEYSLAAEASAGDEAGGDCMRAYPFRYAVKASDGEDLAERLYLLRVSPAGSDAAGYCLPADCH